jgi:transcriptional regulator with XRE-family HTH domain
MIALTTAEAREFGRALRFIRDARRMSLREVREATTTATETGISFQYLHNIEEGSRTGYSDDLVLRLQRAYRLPDHALDDLLLRARVRSALAQRGISTSNADAAYRMMESRLGELGTPIHTDLAELIAGILGVRA